MNSFVQNKSKSEIDSQLKSISQKFSEHFLDFSHNRYNSSSKHLHPFVKEILKFGISNESTIDIDKIISNPAHVFLIMLNSSGISKEERNKQLRSGFFDDLFSFFKEIGYTPSAPIIHCVKTYTKHLSARILNTLSDFSLHLFIQKVGLDLILNLDILTLALIIIYCFLTPHEINILLNNLFLTPIILVSVTCFIQFFKRIERYKEFAHFTEKLGKNAKKIKNLRKEFKSVSLLGPLFMLHLQNSSFWWLPPFEKIINEVYLNFSKKRQPSLSVCIDNSVVKDTGFSTLAAAQVDLLAVKDDIRAETKKADLEAKKAKRQPFLPATTYDLNESHHMRSFPIPSTLSRFLYKARELQFKISDNKHGSVEVFNDSLDLIRIDRRVTAKDKIYSYLSSYHLRKIPADLFYKFQCASCKIASMHGSDGVKYLGKQNIYELKVIGFPDRLIGKKYTTKNGAVIIFTNYNAVGLHSDNLSDIKLPDFEVS